MASKLIHRGKDKDGLDVWRYFISCGTRPDGKRDLRSFTYHGERNDAKRERDRKQYELHNCGPSSASTFREWTVTYLKHAEKTLAPTTVAAYRRMLNQRILPHLGAIRLDQLQSSDINKLMRHLTTCTNLKDTEQKLSGHTQLKYYRLVSTILQEAMYLGMIPNNPAKSVRPPRMEPHRARYYDQKDAAALWEALQGEPLMWRALISTALLLALRRGELMGLRWSDIDWEKKLIRIERAAYLVNKKEQGIKAPKTALSVRSLPLFEQLEPMLKEWRIAQGGGDQDYLCAMLHEGTLKWFHVDTPTKWFSKFIRRRGLPSLNLHGMRHTTATIMLAAGVPIHVVQEFLGHSLPSTTTNTYGHATEAAKERIPGVLTDAFLPTTQPNGNSEGKNEINSAGQ